MDAHELEMADNANVEGVWLDLVKAFDIMRPVRTVALVKALAECEFVSLPMSLPAPKPTVRERVARFILRRF